MNKLLKFISGIGLIAIAGVFVAVSVQAQGFQPDNYFRRVGNAIIPVRAADTLGSTSNRIPGVFADVLDGTTLVISGAATGPIMAPYFVASSTTDASQFRAVTFTDATGTRMTLADFIRGGASFTGDNPVSQGGFYIGPDTAGADTQLRCGFNRNCDYIGGGNGANEGHFFMLNSGFSGSDTEVFSIVGNTAATYLVSTPYTFSATTGTFMVASSSVFLAGDGSVSAPGMSFQGQTNTGFYRAGASINAAIVGATKLTIASGSLTLNSGVSLLAGTGDNQDVGSLTQDFRDAFFGGTVSSTALFSQTVSSTRYNFTNAGGVRWADTGSSNVALTQGTVTWINVSAATGRMVLNNARLGVAGVIADSDGVGSIGISGNRFLNGLFSGNVTSTNFDSTGGQIKIADGNGTNPAIFFGTDTDTGIYSTGIGNISIGTAGQQRFRCGTTACQVVGTNALTGTVDGSADLGTQAIRFGTLFAVSVSSTSMSVATSTRDLTYTVGTGPVVKDTVTGDCYRLTTASGALVPTMITCAP